MAGFHAIRIYTEGDNPWCKTCLNGEKIIGVSLLKDGAYVCYDKGIPTTKGCDNYIKREVLHDFNQENHITKVENV